MSFGPATGPILVFTATNRTNRSAIDQLSLLAAKLGEKPPAVRVSVIITENDFSVLPEEIRTGFPEGTKKVISLLEDTENRYVIILEPGNEDSVMICNGIRHQTSPRWILEKSVESLDRMNIRWDMEEYRMPLYRLGWIKENPLLAAYLRSDIPALVLQTDADIVPTLLDLVSSFSIGIPDKNDSHYLTLKWGGRLYFAGEVFMVIAMIIGSAVILFFLFIISFLFGQKKDQHFRDLMHVWWLPFIFLAVNIFCLYIGQQLVVLLFKFRFGNQDSWRLIPQMAFAGKLLFAWFFITLIMSLNQLIHFPEDNFIYGYIASIVCMINIFVFSSLDFSLCLLFISAYAISSALNQIRHPLSQFFGILFFILPFFPYLSALLAGGSDAIGPLYAGDSQWNIRLALFAMPVQLMISRLLLTLGIFGRKHRFYLPLNLVFVFLLTVIFAGILLFIPAWSQKKPLAVSIRETIDSLGSRVSVKAPVELQNLVVENDTSVAATPELSPHPSSFIQIQTESRKFLERRLVNIVIVPSIPAQKIEVAITSETGLSVYNATIPFEQRNAGSESIFSSGENPETPFTVNFSSDIASNLTAVVRVWTRTNPYGIVIRNKDLEADYLLEIVSSLPLSEKNTEGQ